MRPSKISPQIKKKIGNSIKLGMPFKYAAEAAGISEPTFFRWMQAGEAAESGIYREFREYIKKCQAEAVETHLKTITNVAKSGNWQASAWILERRHPEEFGRKDRLDMKADVSSRIDTPLTPEVIEASNQYLKAIAKAKQEKTQTEEKNSS